PRRVLISDAIEDVTVLSDYLSAQRGGPVEVRVPQRGDSRRLIERARETALAALRQSRTVDDYDAAKTEALLDDLAARLKLPAPARGGRRQLCGGAGSGADRWRQRATQRGPTRDARGRAGANSRFRSGQAHRGAVPAGVIAADHPRQRQSNAVPGAAHSRRG